MEIHIRHAKSDDAPFLAAVEVNTWRAAYRGLMPDAYLAGLSEAEKTETWRHDILKHAELRRKRVLVADGANGIVGFVRVGAAPDEPAAGFIYLLYLLPEYWRGGTGTLLMRAAIDELVDMKLHDLTLWVLRDNMRARRFYERLGWQHDGQTTSGDYGGVELEAVCYRISISPDVD